MSKGSGQQSMQRVMRRVLIGGAAHCAGASSVDIQSLSIGLSELMRILVLAQEYPKNGRYHGLTFVHPRVQFFISQGHSVTVLSFQEDQFYAYEGIPVVGERHFLASFHIEDFDVVASHAPNIRNHFRFLMRHRRKLKSLVFFFHGHEALIRRRYYPKDYDFERKSVFRVFLRDVYDHFKVRALRRMIPWLGRRTHGLSLVFVSDWMRGAFEANVGVIKGVRTEIIANPVHGVFIEKSYQPQVGFFAADFVTIRPFDSPKYAIDQVVELAHRHPQMTFHLYGDGRFFDSRPCPRNIVIKKGFISQLDIPSILDQYRFALMPTRLDSQGVLACEIASYGMPLITTGLPVCREVLNGFSNVAFLPLDVQRVNLADIVNDLKPLPAKNFQYSPERLARREMEVLMDVAGSSGV